MADLEIGEEGPTEDIQRSISWLRKEDQRIQEGARVDVAGARAALARLNDRVDPLLIDESHALQAVAACLDPEMEEDVLLLALGLFVGLCSPSESEPPTSNLKAQIKVAKGCGCLEKLREIFHTTSNAVQMRACRLLADLLFQNEDMQKLAVEIGHVETLTELASSQSVGVLLQGSAARCLSYFDVNEAFERMMLADTYGILSNQLFSLHVDNKIGALLTITKATAHQPSNLSLENFFICDIFIHLLKDDNTTIQCGALQGLCAMLRFGTNKDVETISLIRERVKTVKTSRAVDTIVNFLRSKDENLCVQAGVFISESQNRMLIPEPVIAQEAVSPEPSMPNTARSSLGKGKNLPASPTRRGVKAPTGAVGSPHAKAGNVSSPTSRRGSVESQTSVQSAAGGRRGSLARSTTSRRGSATSMASSVAPSTASGEAKKKLSPRPLISELLKYKENLQYGVACLLSRQSQSTLDVALKILPAAIQRSKEFVSVFSNYSVTWPLADVILQSEKQHDLAVSALNFLVKLNAASSANGALLIREEVQQFAKSQNIRISMGRMAASPLVGTVNKGSVAADIKFCNESISDPTTDELLRTEMVKWLQAMVQATSGAREQLMREGVCEHVLTVLSTDHTKVSTAFKVHCVDLLCDVFTDWRYNPDADPSRQYLQAEGTEQQCKTLTRICQVMAHLLAETHNWLEPAAQELIRSCGAALCSMVLHNTPMQLLATSTGLVSAAMDMLESDILALRIVGTDMIYAICSGAPTLVEACLFSNLENDDGAERPRLLAELVASLRRAHKKPRAPAPHAPPAQDAAGSSDEQPDDGDQGAKQPEEMTEFERRAAKEEEQMMLEVQPLILSSLRALHAIVFRPSLSPVSSKLLSEESVSLCSHLAAIRRIVQQRLLKEGIAESYQALMEHPNPRVQIAAADLMFALGQEEEEAEEEEEEEVEYKTCLAGIAPCVLSILDGFSASRRGVVGACVLALCTCLQHFPVSRLQEANAQKVAGMLMEWAGTLDEDAGARFLKCIRALCQADPRIRKAVYESGLLRSLQEEILGEDRTRTLFAMKAFQMLAAVDAAESALREAEQDLSGYFALDRVAPVLEEAKHLLQASKEPREVATCARTIGALSLNRQVAETRGLEDLVYPLVMLLSSSTAEIVAAAAGALRDLAQDWMAYDIRRSIKTYSAIPCLISLLSNPDHLLQSAVCDLLRSVALDREARPLLIQNDTVARVVRLIRCSCCAQVQASAILALSTIVQSNGSARRLHEQSGMQTILKAARSGKWRVVQAAAVAVQSILSRRDPEGSIYYSELISQFSENGGVALFRSYMLRGGHIPTVRECMKVWRALSIHEGLVTAIRDGDVLASAEERADESIDTVILKSEAARTIAAFSQILPEKVEPVREWILSQTKRSFQSESMEERMLACFCVCHTAHDSAARAALFAEHGAAIEQMLNLPSVLAREAAAAAAEAVCRADEQLANTVAGTTCAERLYEMLRSKHEAAIAQAARTLGALAKWDQGLESVVKEMKGIGKKEGVRPLLNTMMDFSRSPKIQIACSAALQEVAKHRQWQVVICDMSSEYLIKLLQSNDPEVVLQACYTLGTMAEDKRNGNRLRTGGIVAVLNGLLEDSSEDVRYSACDTIQNMAHDTDNSALFLRLGTVRGLLLMMRKDTLRIVVKAAKTIEKLLHLATVQGEFMGLGGIDAIGDLLSSVSSEVRSIAGRLLDKLVRTSRNKEAFIQSGYMERVVDMVGVDVDFSVRQSLCSALTSFAGNEALVNMEYKERLYKLGFVSQLYPLLDTESQPVRRVAAEALASMSVFPAVQEDVMEHAMMPKVVDLLRTQDRRLVSAGAAFIQRATSLHKVNRGAAHTEGAIPLLVQHLSWSHPPTEVPAKSQPAETKAEAKPQSLAGHWKRTESQGYDAAAQAAAAALAAKREAAVRGLAAAALTSILECNFCRRTYQGRRGWRMELQGVQLEMPSVADVYICPHWDVCQGCAACAHEAGVVQRAMEMLRDDSDRVRCQAALLVSALGVGAPVDGACQWSAKVTSMILEDDNLLNLLRMIRAVNVYDPGRAASEQFAAARAVASVAVTDEVRLACCKAGFISPLVDMLYTTFGKVKGAASVALAKLSASDDLCFFFHRQSERTFWERPQELVSVTKANGTQELLDEDEVQWDGVRKGFWVRGILKPIEQLPFCDMLVANLPVLGGSSRGMQKLKADAKVVTPHGVVDLILDIFRSPLYDSSINGWAAEACSVLSEFANNRAFIADSDCVGAIIALLHSDLDMWKEQAAVALSVLLTSEDAREKAGRCGVAEALTEILNSKRVTDSLRQSAALAMSKVCWNAGNQVHGLMTGAVMPLIEMAVHEDPRNWYCGVEALSAVCVNEENSKTVGRAGAMSSIVAKLRLSNPVQVTVRLLAAISRLVATPDNCDNAVQCGVMMPLLDLVQAQELLVLQYLVIAMRTLCRVERWKRQFVSSGLCDALVSLASRCATTAEVGKRAGAGLVRDLIAEMIVTLARSETFQSTLVAKGTFHALRRLLDSPEAVALEHCGEAVALLCSKDAWMKEAREAGLLRPIALLLRSHYHQVQLQGAAAVIALGSDPLNMRGLVEVGALHGLRDMLDGASRQCRSLAVTALAKLSRDHRNASELVNAGALRSLVGLVGSAEEGKEEGRMRDCAALTLARVSESSVLDRRGEVVSWGAVPALAKALERQPTEQSGGTVRALKSLSRNVLLDSLAAKSVNSFALVEQRAGHVHPDAIARQSRDDMLHHGSLARLRLVTETSSDPSIVKDAELAIAHLTGSVDKM